MVFRARPIANLDLRSARREDVINATFSIINILIFGGVGPGLCLYRRKKQRKEQGFNEYPVGGRGTIVAHFFNIEF